jgi:hypothetical protein
MKRTMHFAISINDDDVNENAPRVTHRRVMTSGRTKFNAEEPNMYVKKHYVRENDI